MTTNNKHIFMLGIGGSGMRGLAFLLHKQGNTIIGTDDTSLSPADELHDFATIIPIELAEEAVQTSSLLIYSDAVPEIHPVRTKTRSAGIPEEAYQQALGKFSAQFETLAVTGTHGKSTTTAMLAHVLMENNIDPTVLVGAPVPAFHNGNAHNGSSSFFVVEADEYREHFLALFPAHLIITSIDFDHPDFFSSLTVVEKAYEKCIGNVKHTGTVFVLRSVFEQHPSIHWKQANSLTIVDDVEANTISLGISGQHMRENAILVKALCLQLGLSGEQIDKSLASFSGIGRRMEKLGAIQTMNVFSDYGHHPTEISATLQGIRESNPQKKILAIFEAHMIERLEEFQEQFGKALTKADGVLLCPVFMPKGRSVGNQSALSALRQQLLEHHTPTTAITDYTQLQQALEDQALTYDLAVAFTAGVLDGKLRNILKKQ